jgi:hypothetical protein
MASRLEAAFYFSGAGGRGAFVLTEGDILSNVDTPNFRQFLLDK